MAQISIVRKSQLEGAMRLDAEYYQPKYLRIMEALQALGAVPLSDVAKPMKRKFKPNENPFNYIEIAEVDIGTGATNATEIDGMEAPSRAQWIVREGDVIISTVRPARNAVALIGNGEDGFVCSSGFAVLRSDKTSSEFLFAYLKTGIVASLLDRKTTATMYPAVSWDDVLSLPVVLPDPDTERFISNKVKESRQRLKDSESLYLQAEQRLLDELGFKELDLSHQLHYTVPFQKTREANRLDAEHFQPRCERLLQHLVSTGKSDLLGNLVAQPIKRGLQPTYVEGGEIIVVNSKYVGKQFVNIEQAERTDLEFWQVSRRAQAKKYDVIMNSTGWGTIGRANCILHEQKTVVDNHVTIIRCDEGRCNPVYLAVFLNSKLGQIQTEKWLSGSSGQIEIYPADIARYVVYLPPTKFQHRIADLVTQSWEACQKARQLLEEAKHKVEAIIEGKAS